MNHIYTNSLAFCLSPKKTAVVLTLSHGPNSTPRSLSGIYLSINFLIKSEVSWDLLAEDGSGGWDIQSDLI